MGTASKVQYVNELGLEETVRQVEQIFSTDLRTIADETTNDENLLTLVCLERVNLEQIPDEYKDHKKNISSRFGVLFNDNKIGLQKPLMCKQSSCYYIKGTQRSKRYKDIQAKCNECIPCKRSGKSIKPQLPMTEINYLPPVEKPNQEIRLFFTEPRRFELLSFYILVSIDRYSRMPTACICHQ